MPSRHLSDAELAGCRANQLGLAVQLASIRDLVDLQLHRLDPARVVAAR